SVDMGSSRRPSSAKSGQKSPSKSTVLWWQDEEHNREGTGRGMRKVKPMCDCLVFHCHLCVSLDVCSDSEQVPAVNMMAVGMDTLEEEEEKADFFAHLEAGASSSIDYSKLNRELGETLSTGESLLRYDVVLSSQMVNFKSSCSPTYSEDFEDEEKEKETQNEEKNEDERDEEVCKNRHRWNIFPCFSSDLPTAEELMRPIRIDEDHIRGFTLQPVRAIETAVSLTVETVRVVFGDRQRWCIQKKCFSLLQREDESSLVTHLRLQLSEKEHELQFMTAAAEEVHSLRQQMYLLQSKLRSAEEVSQTNRWAEATDSTTEATLKQMEKELKEQETLIKGYQQENEKLYLEVKDQKAKTKANHEAMFRENQHLLSELNYLNNITRLVGNTQLKDHAQRMADLLAQIQTLQRNEALLSEELHRLKQEKQALDVDLQLMKKERDLAIAQVISSTGERHDTHSGEVSALRKKLQWFTDNQELQDRDAARLGAAAAEIQQLKEQVEKLKLEVSKNSSQQQRKAKEKALDLRKMHDLQRQVKELEHILRSRNPNSLPALIYAAAKAENEEEAASQTKKVTDLLEHRIQCLEAELESHDEEAKRNLRAMEQRFHNVKVCYEQQILKMEQKLLQKQQVGVPIPAAEEKVLVKSLEAELQQIRESHMEKEKILQEQIKSLQQQIKSRVSTGFAQSPSRHQRQAEVAFGVRIERMSQELSTKTRTIQELSRTVERLQRERRYMLSAPHPRKEVKCTENKQQHATPSKTTTVSSTQTCRETFPAAHDERIYQPTVYAGSHISEVLQENTALIQRLKMLEEEQEQEKEALQADAAKAVMCSLRHQECAAEQISSLKAQHLRELDQQRATHALEHSSSKVAEQANWIDTQKIQLKHLQEQLKELQGTKDALALSMTRESVLEKQLMRLFKELQEAKDAQSTEVKLLCSLEKKVVNLELRHQHRETLINQVRYHRSDSSGTTSAEVERWKSVAQEKCKEIETFRLELDSILDIIRHLQRQGVVFPPPGQSH
uniref:Centrosomal protein of 162 kDa n=1 Tax=Cynoglossus semilaevis TaxID=244447 RepID=A0A3P8VXP9_CYNSE